MVLISFLVLVTGLPLVKRGGHRYFNSGTSQGFIIPSFSLFSAETVKLSRPYTLVPLTKKYLLPVAAGEGSEVSAILS